MFAAIFGPSSNSTMAATYGTSPMNPGCGGMWTIPKVCNVAFPDAFTHSNSPLGVAKLNARG